MHHRAIVVAALIFAALAAFNAPGQRVGAAPTATPTCTNPKTGEVKLATKWLTSPGTLVGTSGPDVLVGTGAADHILGLGGDDLICSGGWDDTVEGGNGNDVIDADYPVTKPATVIGGAGNDIIYVIGDGFGDAGNDEIHAAFGNLVQGGAGNDSISNYFIVKVDAGSGDDYLQGAGGVTTLSGGSGNDTIVNSAVSALTALDGGSGTDTCTAKTGSTRRCEVQL